MLQVNLNSASRTQGGNSFDDSTLPLIDRNQKTGRDTSGTCPCRQTPCQYPAGLCSLPAPHPRFPGSSHKAVSLSFELLGLEMMLGVHVGPRAPLTNSAEATAGFGLLQLRWAAAAGAVPDLLSSPASR